MAKQKKAQNLAPGDMLLNLGRAFEVISVETDRNKTVVLVNVVGHAPFPYDYDQTVRVK